MSNDLARLAEDLRSRHFGPQLLLLANIWDAASARTVAEAGHPVVATSSAAIAASLREADHEQMDPDTAFAALARIASAVEVPVTADIEAGYGLAPAVTASRLVGAGAVGCNLKDSDHHGASALLDADLQAEKIRAVCEAARVAGVDIVVNARIDVYIRQAVPEAERADETIRRARKYLAAGATCIYPIGLIDEAEIAFLVKELGAPVNVWLRAGSPPLNRLQRIGVARVSIAAGLYRATMAHAQLVAARLSRGDAEGLWS